MKASATTRFYNTRYLLGYIVWVCEKLKWLESYGSCPREWGIDFSSKKKELKTEKCARVGFERAAEGGGGVLAEQKRELSDTLRRRRTDGRTRTSNTVGLIARRVDYVLHNYDAGACGGSLLGGVPWNEELLTHSQKQQHYSSSLCFGKFESWLPFFFSSPQLQLTLLPPLSTTPTQGLSKLWNKWKDVEFCCCYILHNELKHRKKIVIWKVYSSINLD